MILILEDDPTRVQGFLASLNSLDPSLTVLVWRDAWRMIREIPDYLPSCMLMSLDHDLEPHDGDESDLGTGMDVVRFLVTCTQFVP